LKDWAMKRTESDDNPNHYTLNINFGVSANMKNLATVFGDEDTVRDFGKLACDLFTIPPQNPEDKP
jgi:hypothetical protein